MSVGISELGGQRRHEAIAEAKAGTIAERVEAVAADIERHSFFGQEIAHRIRDAIRGDAA